MTSCMIFSCERFSTVLPMRLAGTCRVYSNSAMPQLTRIATISGRARRLRRCAYHANVMKMLEQTSSPADVATVLKVTLAPRSVEDVLPETRFFVWPSRRAIQRSDKFIVADLDDAGH